MTRGSRFTTILTWFREASPDEVRAIMPLVLEACGRRHILISAPAVARKQRRLNGADKAVAMAHGAGSPISEDLR